MFFFNNNDFLKYPYSYLLTLNVDWFQPFTHAIYSTGAVYLTVQDIPRSERYKTNNIILVGLMPGPKELILIFLLLLKNLGSFTMELL